MSECICPDCHEPSAQPLDATPATGPCLFCWEAGHGATLEDQRTIEQDAAEAHALHDIRVWQEQS